SRIGGSIGAAGVSYSTSSGTATAGSDFTSTSGTLSFGDGETTKTFSVPILEDSSFEGPETFTVTLSNPTGGTSIGATPAMTLTVNVIGDTQWESDETFYVYISSSVVSIAKSNGIGTIRNDDAGPTVSINDVTLTEGDNGTKNATFTVSMSPAWSGYYADISYFTRDGSAKAGSDYTFQSGYI